MRRIQGQSDSSCRIARERRHEDALAVIGIGDMSGEQHEEHLREELRQLGFSTATTRPSALRQLVLQAPAPVIARSLGFHDKTTTRIAAEAGGTWKHYAPGDHGLCQPQACNGHGSCAE